MREPARPSTVFSSTSPRLSTGAEYGAGRRQGAPEKVQADVLRVVKSEKFRERLAQIGVEPFAAEPAALADLVVEELKHYRAIAARPGMQLE